MDFSKEKLSKDQIANATKIIAKAHELGVDPELALAVAWQESKFINQDNPDSGAIGIMQVMPANAKGLNIKVADLRNPDINIESGVKILKENLERYEGNPRAALVAYNASPTTADKYIKEKESFDVLPQETRNYLENIHTFYPLSTAQAEEQPKFFDRAKAEPVTFDVEPKQEKSGVVDFVAEHPAISGGILGGALGTGEQLYKYGKNIGAKDATEKAIREALEKEYVLKAGDKWASAIGGPGGETVTEAAKNLQTAKRLGEGETLTRSGIALPPGAKEKLEQESLTEGQKLSRKLHKTVPFYGPLVDIGGKMARGASKVVSKFAPISTGATGLIGGAQLGESVEKFKRGDIKGGALSGLAGASNIVATQPFFPQARGVAALASIPLDIADILQDPEQYSVVKEQMKKEKAKGGLV